MSPRDGLSTRRFYRDSRRGMIGGVCAGIADYFAFNLTATRILTVVMLISFMPVTLLAYFGCVMLVPSDRGLTRQESYDPGFRKAMRSNPANTLADVKRKFQKLDSRLARLERYVTSSQFNLDQEFRNL